MPRAAAEPAPGEPGGNHSKPGDNKKKNRDQQRQGSGSDYRSGSDSSRGDSNNSDRQRPTSVVDAQQNGGSQIDESSQSGASQGSSEASQPRVYQDHKPNGQWAAGNSGRDGFAEEQAAFDEREEATGNPVIRTKIRVSMPNPNDPSGRPITREYDGLEEISPGIYRGLEHKLDTGRPYANQKLFDGLVRSGIPGRGTLDGNPIQVTEVEYIYSERPPAPSSGPDIPVNLPQEMPAVQSPLEAPVTPLPLQVPVSLAPEIRAPVSLPPAVPVTFPPELPVTAMPQPPVAPQIGVPVAPAGSPLPPVPVGTPAPPIGVPVTAVPTFAPPPPAEIPWSTGAPFEVLQHRYDALYGEYMAILARQSALTAVPTFAERPADVAEWTALKTLGPQVAQRLLEIDLLLHGAPAVAPAPVPVAPPPALSPGVLGTIGNGLAAVATAIGSVASLVPKAVPVPVP